MHIYFFINILGQTSTPIPKKASLTPAWFEIVEKQAISESHPDVQKLVDAGYQPEIAIEALKHCKSIPEAIDFLESDAEFEGDIFSPTIESQTIISNAKQSSNPATDDW